MMTKSFIARRQFLPGPTKLWSSSGEKSLMNTTYHRSKGFEETLRKVRQDLAQMFGSKNKPVILTSSGTGAMESAVLNLTSESDEVLVLSGGKFGERWAEICKEYRCQLHLFEVPWGKALSLENLELKLKELPNLKACFFQGTETSTGVTYPIENIIKLLKKNTKALVVVDAVTSLCSEETKMDEWGVDCMIGSSQKGFHAGSGLSFVALSDKALNMSHNGRSKYYFDYKREFASQEKGFTSCTPAITLVEGLEKSLRILKEFGFENLRKEHKRITNALRKALGALGMKFFAEDSYAHSVTAFYPQNDIDPGELFARIRDTYKVELAGGQAELKGKILRIGHLGLTDPLEMISCLSALEFALKDLQVNHSFGLGVKVFMENYWESFQDAP